MGLLSVRILGFLGSILCIPSFLIAAELTEIEETLKHLLDGQTKIQNRLEVIESLLQRTTAIYPDSEDPVILTVHNKPFKGEQDAKVTIIEFSDYQCPFCARHFRETLPLLEKNYISSGKVKYVFRDYPLTQIHKKSRKAAEAANCAGFQGRYWDMHDRLFANRNALGSQELMAHADTLGLDLSLFQECLTSGQGGLTIQEDFREAQKAGVRGTPTFFFGITVSQSPTITAEKRLRGAQPFDQFQRIIEELLTEDPPAE